MEWEHRLQELTQLIKDSSESQQNHSLKAGLKGVKLLCMHATRELCVGCACVRSRASSSCAMDSAMLMYL